MYLKGDNTLRTPLANADAVVARVSAAHVGNDTPSESEFTSGRSNFDGIKLC